MALFGYKPLKGKVAIVTGGSRGIGLGIADKLASLGAKVVVCAIHPEKIKHMFVPCDVSKKEDVQRVVDLTIKKFKKIDILVNNAGIYPFAPLTEMTEEQWDQVMDINLKGTFFFTKAVLPHMINKKYGKIVNLSSIAGTNQGYPGLVHYCTTKAGIIGFTRAAAAELAQFNIRVNAIAPGLIETPGTMGPNYEETKQGFIGVNPIKRAGTPKDIAELAAYLVSDASDYVTGQTIIVDGGNTIV